MGVAEARTLSVPHAPAACANCATPLVGAWCHACGQKAHLHDKLSHLVHELIEGIMHFDGRLWRTLPLLAFNPGRLSREWMEGRRVRYVAPLHVFLFAIFLVFLLPPLTGRQLLNFNPANVSSPVVTSGGAVNAAAPAATSDFERQALKFVGKLQEKSKDGRYYSYKIETLAYKLAFVLAPLSMIILALVTLRRSRRYSAYQHGVVALYGLGAAAFLFCLLTLTPQPAARVVGPVVFLALPLHAIAHLKGAYGFRWPGAVVRGFILCALVLLAFVAFVTAVTFLGLFG